MYSHPFKNCLFLPEIRQIQSPPFKHHSFSAQNRTKIQQIHLIHSEITHFRSKLANSIPTIQKLLIFNSKPHKNPTNSVFTIQTSFISNSKPDKTPTNSVFFWLPSTQNHSKNKINYKPTPYFDYKKLPLTVCLQTLALNIIQSSENSANSTLFEPNNSLIHILRLKSISPLFALVSAAL
jgi:hypothetical protein